MDIAKMLNIHTEKLDTNHGFIHDFHVSFVWVRWRFHGFP